MLADLDQSKQLMDKFCDSELLESLDMLLTSSRLHMSNEVECCTMGNLGKGELWRIAQLLPKIP